jgi:hypothetical protein
VHAVLLPRVVGNDDVGVLELADRFDFALETGRGPFVAEPVGGQQLDGHPAVEVRLPRLVDRAHSPFAKLGHQLITVQLWQRPRGRRWPTRILRAEIGQHRLDTCHRATAFVLGDECRQR